MKSEPNSITSPSIQGWAELYKAAMDFKEIQPWRWMWDSDLFGVQNSSDGEIGYCCVLGRRGEFFGLAVYLGSEGLEGYLKIQDRTVNIKSIDVLHLKRCLLASFEDRKYLQRPDIEIIKKLGLVFRGRNAWPSFRSYQPGYFPWYLAKEEVEFLTICLQQAKEVVLRFKENTDLFNSPDKQTYFVRILHTSGGNMVWKDSWLKPAPLRKVVFMVKSIDEGRLETIKKDSSRARQTWEVDFFYAPMYIAEKGKRPYYPILFLFVDRDSYFILNAHITTQDRYRVEFHEQFLKTIERIKVLPEEIHVRKEELFFYLEQLAAQMGIKVRLMKKLAAVDDARKSMFEYFTKRR